MTNLSSPLTNTVLIVDDTPDNISVLHRFLAQAGFRVLVACDGADGLETAIFAKPDIILLDVMMPELDGFSVCQQLKANPETSQIPVIFMTALNDVNDKIKGFKVGAVDYITKPFQQEEVLVRLDTQLKLLNSKRELIHRNEELDAFAHTVSHDLKNPLSSILTLADTLLIDLAIDKPLTELHRKELAFIRQAGQQAVNIIDALLLLAGVSRHAPVSSHIIDMQALLMEVVQLRLSLLIRKYNAKIDIQPPLPSALGYAPWLTEVWMNYISNAIKYGGTPPHISIGGEVIMDQARFWVRDNGHGINPEIQNRLFSPFVRDITKRVDGYGLGLSIVRRIIEKLGGQVGVQTTTNQGSLFYFTLPLGTVDLL